VLFFLSLAHILSKLYIEKKMKKYSKERKYTPDIIQIEKKNLESMLCFYFV